MRRVFTKKDRAYILREAIKALKLNPNVTLTHIASNLRVDGMAVKRATLKRVLDLEGVKYTSKPNNNGLIYSKDEKQMMGGWAVCLRIDNPTMSQHTISKTIGISEPFMLDCVYSVFGKLLSDMYPREKKKEPKVVIEYPKPDPIAQVAIHAIAGGGHKPWLRSTSVCVL